MTKNTKSGATSQGKPTSSADSSVKSVKKPSNELPDEDLNKVSGGGWNRVRN
jgi:hypothetical protein